MGTRSGWFVGELAERAGISTEAVRHYERRGLLPRPRRLANNYRLYPDAALATLEVIRNGRAFGFSLEELRAILPFVGAARRTRVLHPALRELLAGKLASLDSQIDRLRQLRAQLGGLLADEPSPERAGEACAMPPPARRRRHRG